MDWVDVLRVLVRGRAALLELVVDVAACSKSEAHLDGRGVVGEFWRDVEVKGCG